MHIKLCIKSGRIRRLVSTKDFVVDCCCTKSFVVIDFLIMHLTATPVSGGAVYGSIDLGNPKDFATVNQAVVQRRWRVPEKLKDLVVAKVNDALESIDPTLQPDVAAKLGTLAAALERQNQADEHHADKMQLEAAKAAQPTHLTQVNILAASGIPVDRANLIARLSKLIGPQPSETQS